MAKKGSRVIKLPHLVEKQSGQIIADKLRQLRKYWKDQTRKSNRIDFDSEKLGWKFVFPF